MAKKKGDLKLIMPKHSASVDHFRLSLKVCISHPSGVDVDAFKDELFAELQAANLETTKNHDGSHYTKCLQLPRYFGLVRYCLSGERANAITRRGREMFAALSADPIDRETIWKLINDAILRNRFGRDNEGVGSESYCEPLAVFFRASKDLLGITNSEYGYLIQELDSKGRPYKQILSEIETARFNGGVQNAAQSQASNLSDWKTILFLKNIGFLERDVATGRMTLASNLEPIYGCALYKLPLYSRGFKRQLFMRWMEAKGLGQSVVNYSNSLGAMAGALGEKSSAAFSGFFTVLTGKGPVRDVYDLNSLSEYNYYYSKLNEFWELPLENAPGDFNEDAFFECFYYARGSKNIDNHRLLKSCEQYKEFLHWWDENKNDFAVEDFDDLSKETIMVSGELGPLQRISYGAPGTGKSKGVNDITSAMPQENVIRTTFHPDSDYSTFVGAYKPKMECLPRTMMKGEKIEKIIQGDKDLLVEKKIAYEFVPQAFAKAYVQAWKKMANPAEGNVQPVLLVIEEINRGDCAKVFGDLFQLLDRRVKDDEHDPSKKAGFSEYPVLADSDLADYIRRELADDKSKIAEAYPSVVADDKLQLILPPNLYIWATMNTSDQSLFPMDSAFKRRWDWKYVPIAKPDKSDDSNWKERKIKVGSSLYDWWDFLAIINKHIAKATESEDKQVGYFFVKAPDDTGYITADQFANKVLFYLYGDVFKSYDLPAAAFKREGGVAWTFRDFFYSETVVVQKADGQIVKDSEGNAVKTVSDGTTQMLKRPGDVNEFELASFLDHLKWKDEVVGKTSIGAGADV